MRNDTGILRKRMKTFQKHEKYEKLAENVTTFEKKWHTCQASK